MDNKHLGTDIALSNGDFVIKADGDINLASCRDCLSQDMRNMILANVNILGYVKDEATEINRLDLEQAITSLIEEDPRVIPGTAICEVTVWERDNVRAQASFQPVDEGNPMNLVLGFDLVAFTVEVLAGG